MSALPPDGAGTPDAAAGGKRKGRTKTHHTVAKAVGATMVVIALVTGLSVVVLYRHYNGNLNVKDVGRARLRTADAAGAEGSARPDQHPDHGLGQPRRTR